MSGIVASISSFIAPGLFVAISEDATECSIGNEMKLR